MSALPNVLQDPAELGVVLLAAGAGSRMGHRPKCLLTLSGEPLIRRQLSAIEAAGVTQVVVVLGHHATRVEAVIQDLRPLRVTNPDPQPSPVSSLRMGLQALPSPLDAVMVVLADQPLLETQDILDLVDAFQNRPIGTEWVRPVVDGLPGNPVIFSARVRAEILAADRSVGGPQWAQAHPEQVHPWVSPNRHYLTDVDTMADVQALAALTGHKLQWPADLAHPRPGPATEPNA